MDWTNALQLLLAAFAGAIGLLTTVGLYLLSRLRQLEIKEAEADAAVVSERDGLRKRVADLELRVEKIPGLERQIAALINQLDDLKKRSDEAADENGRLRDENKTLRTTNAKQDQALHDVTVSRDTLRELIRGKLDTHAAEQPERAPEPGEHAADAETPEAAE